MIGVLGGTFDPIHFGHLRPALDCLQILQLDQVRIIPLNVAVHRDQPIASGAQRWEMLQAAVAGQPGFMPDHRELDRPGGSYSFDTLTALRAELGNECSLCLLVGADAFMHFLNWYRAREILDLAHLVVMSRPQMEAPITGALEELYRQHRATSRQDLAAAPAGRILFQQVTQMDISATQIRNLFAHGQSARYLLPDTVIEIIDQAGLYRERAPVG